jgi:hypothetical protein
VILFIAKIYSFIDSRDSGKRISKLDHPNATDTVHHREMILNPHFISDMTVNATYGTNLKYSDNFFDKKERYSTVIVDKSISAIKTYTDTAPNSNTIQLPIYPNNNPDKTAVNTTIQWASIIYADRYNPNPDNKCWVVYLQGAFRRREVLVALAIEDVMRLVKSGNTTSTFTSVHNFFSTSYEKTNVIK